MTDPIQTALHQIAAEHLRWEGPLPQGDLAEHLDSMQRLALVVAIEDHFQIAFEPEDDEQANTLAEVEAVIRRHLTEGTRGD